MSSNGKRVPVNSRPKDNLPSPPSVQPQEELIKFICDSWNKVFTEYQKGLAQGAPTVSYHSSTEPNPLLKDFVPFDLDAYWGQRAVQRVVQNMSAQNIPTHNV